MWRVQKQEKPKCVLCSAYTESGDLLTGDLSGSLFLWPRGQQKVTAAAAGAHEGGLFALALYKDAGGNARILSGGKDRKIVQWDAGLARLAELVVRFALSFDRVFVGSCTSTIVLQHVILSRARTIVSLHTVR